MARVNFTKVEHVLHEALHKASIDHLKELATIANLLGDAPKKMENKDIEPILDNFRQELKRIKKSDPTLYQQLSISPEQEKRFDLSVQDLKTEDWSKIKAIREQIPDLKKELRGHQSKTKEEDEKIVEAERVKHINKRFKVRDGWLPLK